VDNIIRTNNFFRVGENATMFLGVGGAISGAYSLTDFILYNTAGDAYLLASGAKGLKISADTGAATFASTVQTTGITPTNLTTNYIPMKSSGVLVDSPISIANGGNIGINGTTIIKGKSTGLLCITPSDDVAGVVLYGTNAANSVANWLIYKNGDFGLNNISANGNIVSKGDIIAYSI